MMPVLRRTLVMLTLMTLLLQGLLAQPVSARQCLRLQAVEHCVQPGHHIASFGELPASAPALLPAGIVIPSRAASKTAIVSLDLMRKTQTEVAPRTKPPRV